MHAFFVNSKTDGEIKVFSNYLMLYSKGTAAVRIVYDLNH